MDITIKWSDRLHGQESLSFGDKKPPAGSAPPVVMISGRRFYLQSAACHDPTIIQKIKELQPFLFFTTEQFVHTLQATSVLGSKNIQVQSHLGNQKFLEKTLPQIEGARIQNQNLLTQNPYFRANSAYPGQTHPLYIALFQRNHALLKELCQDPHLLLINEKIGFQLLDGSQMMASPFEITIMNNDPESAKILLSAPALNRQIRFPREVLKRLGPEKASPFIKAYVKMKPDWIDSAYLKSDFEELRNEGFSDKDINRLKNYYSTNMVFDNQIALPKFAFYLSVMLQFPHGSEEFDAAYQDVQNLLTNPLTNLNARDRFQDLEQSMLCLALVFFLSTNSPKMNGIINHPENKSYLLAVLTDTLKNGQYTIDDQLYSFLEDLPKEFFDAIPAEKIEVYKREKYTPDSSSDNFAYNRIYWALATRINLVTLLGNISHTISILHSPHQSPKWITQSELIGGNTRKDFANFCYRLNKEKKPFSEDLSLAVDVITNRFLAFEKLQRIMLYTEDKPLQKLVDNAETRQFIHELADDINGGKRLRYLKFETPGHTQAVLFCKEYEITCDRRLIFHPETKERVDGTCIKVYSQPEKISEEVLWDLLSDNDASSLLLEQRLMRGNLLHEILIKPQKHNNCSWASDVSPAIQVAFQLFDNPDCLLKEGKFSSNVIKEMKQFNHFAKALAIQDYITWHRAALSESPGMPDPELTGKALFYTLYKCAMKDGDEHYLGALDKLVYSGFPISSESFNEYSPDEQEKMKTFLEKHFSIKGLREYLQEIGYPNMDNKRDADAFLTYLSNLYPSTGIWPQYLLS